MSAPGAGAAWPSEERIARALRDGTPARAGFRDALRRSFLGEHVAESASRSPRELRSPDGMSDRLEQRIAAQPLAPAAREEFRTQLRERFLSGAEGPSDAPGPRAVVSSARRLPAWAGGLLAAAAVLLIALAIQHQFSADETGLWKVTEISGRGPVRIDGRALDPLDRETLSRAVLASARVESLDNRLVMRHEQGPILVLREGSEMCCRAASGDPEAPCFDLSAGELFLKADRRGSPDPIRIATPEGEIRVLGTTVGVCLGEGYACVCVVEGEVEIEPRDERWGKIRVPRRTSQVVNCVGGEEPCAHCFPDEPDSHIAELVAFHERY
jgi:ferric-dicitrate binding protein FerR (iron transport regulator)